MCSEKSDNNRDRNQYIFSGKEKPFMSSDTGAKWIKIDTDIFNNTKIRLIKSYPNGDTIIAIWFELLCLAGKTNNGGFFMISDRIPITEKMFASIFGRTENEVIMAFDAFKALGMIVVTDIANESVYTIKNWNKYQALDALEAKRERDKQYQKQRRERKLLEKKKTVEQKKTDGVAQGVLQLTDGSYGVGNEQDFNSDTDGFSVDEIIPAGFNESSNGESLMSDDESSDSRLTSGDASLKIVSPDIDTEKEEEDIEIAKAISSSNSKFDEEVEEVPEWLNFEVANEDYTKATEVDEEGNEYTYYVNGIDYDLVVTAQPLPEGEQYRTAKVVFFQEGAKLTVTVEQGVDPNGISTIVADSSLKNRRPFNLAGQPVDKNYKGIVVKDGKKVLVK